MLLSTTKTPLLFYSGNSAAMHLTYSSLVQTDVVITAWHEDSHYRPPGKVISALDGGQQFQWPGVS